MEFGLTGNQNQKIDFKEKWRGKTQDSNTPIKRLGMDTFATQKKTGYHHTCHIIFLRVRFRRVVPYVQVSPVDDVNLMGFDHDPGNILIFGRNTNPLYFSHVLQNLKISCRTSLKVSYDPDNDEPVSKDVSPNPYLPRPKMHNFRRSASYSTSTPRIHCRSERVN